MVAIGGVADVDDALAAAGGVSLLALADIGADLSPEQMRRDIERWSATARRMAV